jgi:hypothetical protein
VESSNRNLDRLFALEIQTREKFETSDSLREILLDFGWEVTDDKESFSIKPIAQQPPIAPPD